MKKPSHIIVSFLLLLAINSHFNSVFAQVKNGYCPSGLHSFTSFFHVFTLHISPNFFSSHSGYSSPLSSLNLISRANICCITHFLYASTKDFFSRSFSIIESTVERNKAILVCSGREGKDILIFLITHKAMNF